MLWGSNHCSGNSVGCTIFKLVIFGNIVASVRACLCGWHDVVHTLVINVRLLESWEVPRKSWDVPNSVVKPG